jgi:asparagine synthetase B (glutamine-hydrolysing)
MAARMKVFGPDAEGFWSGYNIALSHQLLSVLDLDVRDNQPPVDGVNTWFANKAAAESGCKVLLSGVRGDEIPFFHRFLVSCL